MNQTKTIRVVYVEPDKCARVMDLGTELEDMQKAVGGNIQAFYPFDEAVGIVCNEEGKCNGMHPNRAVYGDNKEMLDVIFGPFFICDCSGESFGSLSDEQIETYKNLFRKPERFFVRNNKIVAVPYMPAAAKPDREERYHFYAYCYDKNLLLDKLAKDRGLPRYCYAYLPTTQEEIRIDIAESGYIPMRKNENDGNVKKMNQELGVTPAQAKAMQIGSMFGWDVPGADPKSYNDKGKAIRKKDGREER